MSREFDRMTVTELQELAREWGIRGVSRMRKSELVQQLRRAQRLRVEGEEVDPAALLRQWVHTQRWARWLSLALRAVGGFGVAVSLALMVVAPVANARAIPRVESSLRSGAEAMVSLAGSLELARQALGSAAEVLEGTGEALSAVEQSIANTQPLIESVAGLVGTTVPVTIEGTQRTLETAVQGAQAIDQVLRGLAALSPLTGVRYDPEQTLEASLSEAASGLEPIPAALRDIQGELEDVGAELDSMRGRLRDTSRDLTRFASNLQGVGRDLGQRAADLMRLAAGLERAADSAEVWMWGAALMVELFLLSVAAAQWMLFRVGGRIAAAGTEVM